MSLFSYTYNNNNVNYNNLNINLLLSFKNFITKFQETKHSRLSFELI